MPTALVVVWAICAWGFTLWCLMYDEDKHRRTGGGPEQTRLVGTNPGEDSHMELYYFWKEHCAPCKAAKPIVEQVANSMQLPVQWLNVREPEGERLITPFGLMTVPTLVLVKDKHKIGEASGAELQNVEKLKKRLEKLL